MNIRELLTKLCCLNFFITCINTVSNLINLRYRDDTHHDNLGNNYILLDCLEKEKKEKSIQTEILEEEKSIEEEKRKFNIHIENNYIPIELDNLSENNKIGEILMDDEFQLEKSNFDFIN